MGKDNLRIINLKSINGLGIMVNEHLKTIRECERDVIVPIEEVRFSNGEGKIKLNETVRGKDVYILADIGNHSCTYEMHGYTNHMGPDEHFQDIKRTICAIMAHAERITVIMPLMYSSRQHKRKGRESLDCAIALQELERLGVRNIITFDVHDPNVQNAIPISSFNNFYPTSTMLEDFLEDDSIDLDNLLVISPDTGAMDRALYYANKLDVDVGVFYKRRDLNKIVNGSNPIVAHEYMGSDVNGKDVIVVDDMIASGSSMIEVAEELKKRGAKRIYMFATFALFSSGIENFTKAYESGLFEKLFTTNLTYIADHIKEQKWLHEVDCSHFLAEIISTLCDRKSISPLVSGPLRRRKEKV